MPREPSKPQPPAESGKLPRRFLIALPDGLYLVSNYYELLGAGQYEPSFAERVPPPTERDAQWQRIKAVHADGRNCDAFVAEAHWAAWKRTVQGAPWNRS